MDEVEIIRDSLISGQISLAMSYLQLRKDRGLFENILGNIKTESDTLFDEYKKVACCLVYQALSRDQVCA